MSIVRKGLRLSARLASISVSMGFTAFLLLSAGYILGWNTVPGLESSAVSETLDRVGATAATDRDGGLDASDPDDGVSREAFAPSMRRRVQSLIVRLRPGMKGREAGAFAQAEVARMEENELRAALNELREAPESGVYHELRMMLLIRWVAVNPEAALEYARSNPLTSPVLRGEKIEDILIDVWAGIDPEAAFRKWRSLPEDRRASEYRTGRIIRAMGQRDLDAALAAMDALPAKYRFEALEGLSRTPRNAAERNRLFERAARLPEMKQRASVIAKTLHGWGRDTERANAVEWLDGSGLPRRELDEIERRLAKHWFYEDHRSAADWLLSRARTPERRAETMEDMASIWANYDPVAAGNWLREQPLDETAAPAMRAFAGRLARGHPEDAVAWAAAIPDGPSRRRAIREVSEIVVRRYPHNADEILKPIR